MRRPRRAEWPSAEGKSPAVGGGRLGVRSLPAARAGPEPGEGWGRGGQRTAGEGQRAQPGSQAAPGRGRRARGLRSPEPRCEAAAPPARARTMGAPLAVALGALHYLALFLQLGGATRPAGHAPWDNHVSGHGEFGHRPRGLPHQTPPGAAPLQLVSPRARTCGGRDASPWAPPAGSMDPPWQPGYPCGGAGTPDLAIAESPLPPSTPTLSDTHTSTTTTQTFTATGTLRVTHCFLALNNSYPPHLQHLLRSLSSPLGTHTYVHCTHIPDTTAGGLTPCQLASRLKHSAQLLPACPPADILANTHMRVRAHAHTHL